MRSFIFSVLVLLSMLFVTQTFAGFEGLNNGSSLKIFNRINCGPGVNCERTGNGIFNVDVIGGLQNQVTATATTITASQCGSTFINTGAVQMELPDASTVLGCRLTFITDDASNFDINPDDTDQITVLTNAVGDAIRNATVGNSVTIEAVNVNRWSQVSAIGTWTDIN